MRRIIILLILILNIVSCSTIDKNKDINTSYYDFIFKKKYNEFIYKSKINSHAGSQIYITTNFTIALPKGIQKWMKSDNEFVFDYKNNEFIFINSGYENIGNEQNWTIRNLENNEFEKIFKEFPEPKVDKKRVSKIYSNGKISILLINIKKQNIEYYINLIKNFKYLD